MNESEYTLTEIAKLLQQPQHRLIYLCEKGVVVPDGVDAKGRGTSRRFSTRNLFEFSVAFTLGEFHIPAVLCGKILLTLRSFAKEVKNSIQNFLLPHSLTDPKAPQINIVLTNGSELYFALGSTGSPLKMLGGVDLNEPTQILNLSVTEFTSEKFDTQLNSLEWLPNSSSHAYFTLNLTKIAQELKLK